MPEDKKFRCILSVPEFDCVYHPCSKARRTVLPTMLTSLRKWSPLRVVRAVTFLLLSQFDVALCDRHRPRICPRVDTFIALDVFPKVAVVLTINLYVYPVSACEALGRRVDVYSNVLPKSGPTKSRSTGILPQLCTPTSMNTIRFLPRKRKKWS